MAVSNRQKAELPPVRETGQLAPQTPTRRFEITFIPLELTSYERSVCSILTHYGALQPIQIYYLFLDRLTPRSGYGQVMHKISETTHPPKEARKLIKKKCAELKKAKIEYPSFGKILRHIREMELLGWVNLRHVGRSTYYSVEKSVYEYFTNEALKRKQTRTFKR